MTPLSLELRAIAHHGVIPAKWKQTLWQAAQALDGPPITAPVMAEPPAPVEIAIPHPPRKSTDNPATIAALAAACEEEMKLAGMTRAALAQASHSPSMVVAREALVVALVRRGMSVREIAAGTGMKLAGVYKVIQRARDTQNRALPGASVAAEPDAQAEDEHLRTVCDDVLEYVGLGRRQLAGLASDPDVLSGRVQTVKELRSRGLSLAQITRATGMSHGTVRRYVGMKSEDVSALVQGGTHPPQAGAAKGDGLR